MQVRKQCFGMFHSRNFFDLASLIRITYSRFKVTDYFLFLLFNSATTYQMYSNKVSNSRLNLSAFSKFQNRKTGPFKVAAVMENHVQDTVHVTQKKAINDCAVHNSRNLPVDREN